jgi:hypothetical protein
MPTVDEFCSLIIFAYTLLTPIGGRLTIVHQFAKLCMAIASKKAGGKENLIIFFSIFIFSPTDFSVLEN